MNSASKTLTSVLSLHLQTEITSADYHMTPLQGGTVGTVYLVSGLATTVDAEQLPYRIVLKTQRKWERYGDPHSWRREYDLYASELGTTFSETFRWPTCYYSTNLSHPALIKNTYLHYRSWPVVYDYIRSEECEFPQHIRQMLIDIDEHADEILARIEQLPLVLCHRDFWVTNLIYKDGIISLIDWDTSGWGYLGEDIASLIADEADINHMVEYYRQCVPAYYKGFSEYALDC